jgi:hypothetical protein
VGTVGLTTVADAEPIGGDVIADANGTCNAIVPLFALAPFAGTADACDAIVPLLAAVPLAGTADACEPVAAPLAGTPDAFGGLPATDAGEVGNAPPTAGTVGAVFCLATVGGTAAPRDAPARAAPATPPVAGFAAAETPPGETAAGVKVFLAPAPATGAAAEVDALRGTAPAAAPETLEGPAPLIGTPTGRKAPVGVAPDDEDEIPGF